MVSYWCHSGVMQLTPYVDRIRRDLLATAEISGDETRALAERLAFALDSSARLTLLEALAEAAGEITSELAPGSVQVRLVGRDAEFVVDPPAAPAPPQPGSPLWEPALPALDQRETLAPPATDELAGASRTTLRLPDHLKSRVDDAAAREGISVNAWLVRAAAAALATGEAPPRPVAAEPSGRQRLQGWVQ